MSAFGTKKPGGDLAVQMTFPSVYSSVYASGADKLAYYPTASEGVEKLPAGSDLQSLYHEQKRLDANRMAMAGVRSRAMADKYARAGNAGYGVMPKAVLSQRVYANPSNGNQSDIYAGRYDQMRGAGMSGGVLRTMKGQEYGREKLRGRIDQLNAIAEAKQGFLAGMPVDESIVPQLVEQGIPEPEGVRAKIELIGAVNQFREAVLSGQLDRIAISDFYKSLRLLFRVAVVSDQEELGDLLEAFDEINEVIRNNIRGAIVNFGVGEFGQPIEPPTPAELKEFKSLVEKIRAYIAGMLGGITGKSMSMKDRKALSQNLVRSLGLSKLSTGFTLSKKESRQMREGADRSGEDAFTATTSSYSSGDSRDVRFDPTPRDRFGSRQGSWFGEEAEPESEIRGITVPLNEMRGDMPSAQMPEAVAPASTPSFEAIPEEKVEEAEEEGEEVVVRTPKLVRIETPAEAKYRAFETEDGKKLLVATNGTQFLQVSGNSYKKLASDELYEVPDETATAPAEEAAAAAATQAPDAEKEKRRKEAYARYKTRNMVAPTGAKKQMIDLRIDNGYRITMKEIGDRTGYSTSTVSRVLSEAGVA